MRCTIKTLQVTVQSPQGKICDQRNALSFTQTSVVSFVISLSVYLNYFVIPTGDQVSFVIPLEGSKDKFVITAGRNVAILTWDGESSTPADVKYVCSVDNEKEVQNNRLNDGKADPTGQLWAGMT